MSELEHRTTRLAALERRLTELERDHGTTRRILLARIESLAYELELYRQAAAPARIIGWRHELGEREE